MRLDSSIVLAIARTLLTRSHGKRRGPHVERRVSRDAQFVAFKMAKLERKQVRAQGPSFFLGVGEWVGDFGVGVGCQAGLQRGGKGGGSGDARAPD